VGWTRGEGVDSEGRGDFEEGGGKRPAIYRRLQTHVDIILSLTKKLRRGGGEKISREGVARGEKRSAHFRDVPV